MFQALEGFLFVVSKEGNVEFVTDNVTTFLNYNKDEVLGKSIYNFIHHGDHTRQVKVHRFTLVLVIVRIQIFLLKEPPAKKRT